LKKKTNKRFFHLRLMIFIVDEEAKIRGSHADENDLYH